MATCSNGGVKPREIRVFLSSTFKDMDAERNHLVKQVFPKVRAGCMARQVGFTEIDLRWGVTEEESQNGATVEICLKEIDRCRDFPPFFIGFLGERYGWIPRHEDLIAYWEKRADTDYERKIRHAVERKISVTELEMELAVLAEEAAEKLHGHALFLLRDRTLTDSLYRQNIGEVPDPADVRYYDPAGSRLQALKDRIRATPFLGIQGYTSVEQFGQIIEDYLLAQLDQYFPENQVPTALERQQAAHAAFRYNRLQNFLPRTDVRKKLLKAIDLRIDKPYLGPILLAGPSGQGKSALMADLARHVEGERPEWFVLDHYTGMDDSNHLDSWARRILATLHPKISHLVDGIPGSPKDRKEALSFWIAMACRKHEQEKGRPQGTTKLLLILDAIDQNSDGGKDLDLFKPEVFGPDAIIVVSSADNTLVRETTRNSETVTVPPLTATLKAKMIVETLKRYHKELPAELAQQLAGAEQSGSPLFLSLAIEELRLDARHESLAPIVTDILKAKDAQQLFLDNFLLDVDYGRPELPTLAAAFMALLGASYAGLTENELADLLALPDDPEAVDTKKPRLPQVYLSRMLTAFQPFLLDKQNRRTPMHRIFGEVAMQHYGTAPVREHLYGHFRSGYGGDTPYVSGMAREALFQIWQLSIHDTNNRHRLFSDITNLSLCLNLRVDCEDVFLDVLRWCSSTTKSHLARMWGKQIHEVVKVKGDRAWNHVEVFALWLRSRLGYFPGARLIQEELVALSQSELGEENTVTLRLTHHLADTVRGQKDYVLARTIIERVVIKLTADFGASDFKTLSATVSLAATNHDLCEYSRAKLLYETVLGEYRSALGEIDSRTISVELRLSKTLRAMGSLDEARQLQAKVVINRVRTLGESHIATLNAQYSLALTLHQLGHAAEARSLLKTVHQTRKKVLGKKHPATLEAMSALSFSLGKMLKKLKPESTRVDFAKKLQENINAFRDDELSGKSVALREKFRSCEHRYGRLHKKTLTAIQNYAVALRNSRKLTTAEKYQRESLARFICVHGEDGIETASAYSAMGMLLKLKGETAEAEAYYRKALAIRERELGPEDEATQLLHKRLTELGV